jgi:hypothetical protein
MLEYYKMFNLNKTYISFNLFLINVDESLIIKVVINSSSFGSTMISFLQDKKQVNDITNKKLFIIIFFILLI